MLSVIFWSSSAISTSIIQYLFLHIYFWKQNLICDVGFPPGRETVLERERHRILRLDTGPRFSHPSPSESRGKCRVWTCSGIDRPQHPLRNLLGLGEPWQTNRAGALKIRLDIHTVSTSPSSNQTESLLSSRKTVKYHFFPHSNMKK